MTGCDPADINYNLCMALTDRMAEDSQRLQLLWWGVWALVGLTLVLLIAPLFFRAWSFEAKI